MSDAIYDELKQLLFARDFQMLERRLIETGWERVHEEPWTSLLRAACYTSNAEDLVTWLREKGFKPSPAIVSSNIELADNAIPVQLLIKGMDMDEINYKDEQGENYLFAAVEDGVLSYHMLESFSGEKGGNERTNEILQSCQILTLLIKQGVRVNDRNLSGDTPLHRAVLYCWHGYSAANEAFARLLIEYGADPLVSNKRGETPLDYAIKYDNKELVALLTKQ